jgi:CheY-like chemotaxis protein
MEKNNTGWLKIRSRDKESYPAEDKSKFEASFYKEILDLMPDNVVMVDRNFKVTWANEAVLKMNPALWDKNCYEVFHECTSPCDNCPCRRCLETGAIEKGVMSYLSSNGLDTIYWEKTAIPVKDSKGRIVSAIEISRDVTDRICSSNERQFLSEHLDAELQRSKKETTSRLEFIHKLSSDVKNDIEDMSDQLSYLHHLDEYKNSEWLTSLIELNEKTLRRVGNLNDLFSMEETGVQMVYVPFEITELIDEIYNRFKQKAREKNINLEVHRSKMVPKKMIGDLFRMNSILMNIMENAIKNTQNGNVKVDFYAQEKTEDGHVKMQIVITDSGVGLTSERLEQIQSLLKDNCSKDYFDQAIEMNGLGILTAHNTLKGMDGCLEIDSQYGRGTQVKLNFRMAYKSEKMERKHGEIIHEENLQVADVMNHFKRKTILIAEDEVVGRVTYKIHLQEEYELIFAKNGKEAVELYLAEKPDLVFMDIMMPVMNGLEAFDEIEKHRRRQVPIVACTAKVIDSEKEYLLTYGFSDYLPKPVDVNNLLRLVAKYLK